MRKSAEQSKLGIHDKMSKIGYFESFWTTLVEKDWKKCEKTKIGYSESFWTNLVEKDGKKCEMTKIISARNEFTNT